MRLHAGDMSDLAAGAAVLGSGGGGETRGAAVAARAILGSQGAVRLIAASELDPGQWVVTIAAIGAIGVMVEKLPSGDEFVAAVRTLERHLGVEIAAVQALEAAGINAITPVLCASWLGLPLIDADGMGRAFPRLEQTVFTAAGLPASPAVLADSTGNALIIQAVDNASVELLARAALPALGGWAACAQYPMRAADAGRHAIAGSISRAMTLGRVLRRAERARSIEESRALIHDTGAELLFEGTVIEVRQRTSSRPGVASLEHRGDRDRTMRVELADELLLAVDDGEPVATVPDIIFALDSRNCRTVAADRFDPGQELNIWRLAAPEAWRRRAGDLVDLAGFGLSRWSV